MGRIGTESSGRNHPSVSGFNETTAAKPLDNLDLGDVPMHTLLLALLAFSQGTEPTRMVWTVDDVAREALVSIPSEPGPAGAPVVFVFHGHGGNMRYVARSFHIHKLWPEAIVVYPQGLPTPGQLTDPEGKRAGWQRTAGDQGDRDLKLFDAMLTTLKEKHRVDESRVYATGHSNGGGFTYLLWATRPDIFAAVAPSAAGGRNIRSLKPLPAFHLAGEKDTLVRFDMQRRVMEAVRETNGCEGDGEKWAEGCLLYPSKTDTPFVSFIHPGGHQFPDEAPPLIVRFFKEHAKPQARLAK